MTRRSGRDGGPLRVRSVSTTFDSAAPGEGIESRPAPVRLLRHLVTGAFDLWVGLSINMTGRMGWSADVQPYVGYGTESYSRLICRTILTDGRRREDPAIRGIRGLLTVPAPRTRVRLAIDSTAIGRVQVGDSSVYDAVDPSRSLSADAVFSDRSGYLDLVAEHRLTPGVHRVSYQVRGRRPVDAPLYIVPSRTPVGVISDVDDTIMISQVPNHWKAAWNLLLSNPHRRSSVPGMAVLYNRIRDLDPRMPFFYLSASPWNVEGSIRGFIRDHGFPAGPLLLRDLDPRPKTFVPSIVQHKMEFIHQLMADFPQMRFVLMGDDGQSDPATFAQVVRQYPDRVLAIGIRQLSPSETGLGFLFKRTATQPMPVTQVPVFYGTTGANLMRTLLPYLRRRARI